MNRGLCRTCLFLQGRPIREPQLGVARPNGIVQVDHVLVDHPNCRQAHIAGAAQAKLESAWPVSAGQSNLSHPELVGQQVLFLAQGLVNELAKLVHRVDVVDRGVHRECVVLKATRNRPWSHIIRLVGRPDRYRPICCMGSPIGTVPIRPLRLDGRAEPEQREFL